MTRSLKGSMVAIVTPMHEDGKLDLVAFRELVEWHIREGTSAIVVVGTTGESATLTTQEHCDLVGYCVDVANKRLPIIAGTGSNSKMRLCTTQNQPKNAGRMPACWWRLIIISLPRKASTTILD